MKFIFLILVTINILQAYQSKFINTYAINIYDNNQKENIQNKHKTTYDYNNEVFVTIAVFAKALKTKPKVLIGKSIGSYQSSKRIVKNGLIIGKTMVYKFYTIKNGYLEIWYDKKLYDRKTFIK